MREAVLVAAVRSAIGKAPRGGLSQTRPDDLAALVLQALLARVPALAASEIDDVLLGCAVPEAEQGMNLARVVALRAGLPVTVPGVTVNRFCASGLQTVAMAAQQVMTGMADVVLAGGVESMSLLPMGGYNLSPNPHLLHELPQTYLAMGLTAEQVARQWQVSREDQDAFALRSHQRAAAAWDSGRFQAEVVPVRTRRVQVDAQGVPHVEEMEFAVDEGIRRDTSLAALAQLKPAFAAAGTVTAGNSSQTSDGAAWVLVMAADRARALGLQPLAVFRSFAVAGVDPG
ncbi:MAG: acetyl-CoA C-acyltransferase, partial [Alicyclobacillus sp.]|nr:acetyl-CoA C-acyltransferase [Alicyclobacillus sp.]